MKLWVISYRGRLCRVNDENPAYMLCRSRAHAYRVIRWLGMVGASPRPATDAEIASGEYVRMHGTVAGKIDDSFRAERAIAEVLS